MVRRTACALAALSAVLLAVAGCATETGPGSGGGDVDFGSGKGDGLGVDEGTERAIAFLTLTNLASRRTLTEEAGLSAEAADTVTAARPLKSLADVEANSTITLAEVTPLLTFSDAHLATGGLPTCIDGTTVGDQASVDSGAWETCDVEVAAEELVVAPGKSLVIYPGASVRLSAVSAARGEPSNIVVGTGGTFAVIGGKDSPVVFASGTGIGVLGGAPSSFVRLRHVMFPGEVSAGVLLADVEPATDDSGNALPVEAPEPSEAARTLIENSLVGSLRTAGELWPLTLGDDEAYRASQDVTVRHSVVQSFWQESTTFSGIKCDAPSGQAVVGARLTLDHAWLDDSISAVEVTSAGSVLHGVTSVLGQLSGNQLVGTLTGVAWGDMIVKVLASDNVWSTGSDLTVASPTASTYTSCGADKSEIDVGTLLTEVPTGLGPDVAALSDVVVAVGGLMETP